MAQKIVIIEPEKRDRDLLERALQGSGFEPVFFDLGFISAEGFPLAYQHETFKPLSDASLIIMESNLPAVEGLTLLRILKENKYTSKIPVMALTRDNRYESVLSFLQGGAVDYLVKPFDPSVLLRRVKFVLGDPSVTEMGLGAEGVSLSFHDYLSREFKRAERYQQDLAIILGRIGRPGEAALNDVPHAAKLDKYLGRRFELTSYFISIARRYVREIDMVLRYGPRDLVLVMPMTPKDGAYVVEERLLELFDRQMETEDSLDLRDLQLFTSIAAYPQEGDSHQDLLESAEKSMRLVQDGQRKRVATRSQKDSQSYWKLMFCPVCRNRFQTERPRNRAFSIKGRDSDLKPIYEQGTPLIYSIPVCPHCFYAAEYQNFEAPVEAEVVNLKHSRIERKKLASHVDFFSARSVESAITSYLLAIECYKLRDTAPSVFARLYHQTAWLMRQSGDRQGEESMLVEALEYYERAFMREDLKRKKLSDIEVAYLIGDLSLRLGQPKRGFKYLNSVIDAADKSDRKDLIQLARQRWQQTREALDAAGEKVDTAAHV